ncbi:hypothetical protein ACLB1Q_31360 [Escherichia coli]
MVTPGSYPVARQRCGFVLVRMGNDREASSGCYTAMALLPMSDAVNSWLNVSITVYIAMRKLWRSGMAKHSLLIH